MNAITIQKRANGTYIITGPGHQQFMCLGEDKLVSIVNTYLPHLEPETGREGHGGTTIPERLENQGKMIQGFAEMLTCAPIDSEIRNAISKLKREHEGRLHEIRGLLDSQRFAQSCILRVEAERDGLNKLFDGVTVQRGIDGRLLAITLPLDETPQIIYSNKECFEAGHDSKTPQTWHCQSCGQLNSSWAVECGRCEKSRVMTSTREPRGGNPFIDSLLSSFPAIVFPGPEETTNLAAHCETLHRERDAARKERDQLESDLKLACQQRAEALLENEALKDRERQARYIAGKFIPLFDL